MTAEERIEELDAEMIAAVLARIIRTVEVGGTVARVADILNDWSLIEVSPEQEGALPELIGTVGEFNADAYMTGQDYNSPF